MYVNIKDNNIKQETTANVFLKPELPIGFNYCQRTKEHVFRQSNKSADFIAGNDYYIL